MIETEDRPGILAKLTEAITKFGANIRLLEAQAVEVGRGSIEVVVEVTDSRQLTKLRDSLLAVKGVLSVSRNQGGRKRSSRNL